MRYIKLLLAAAFAASLLFGCAPASSPAGTSEPVVVSEEPSVTSSPLPETTPQAAPAADSLKAQPILDILAGVIGEIGAVNFQDAPDAAFFTAFAYQALSTGTFPQNEGFLVDGALPGDKLEALYALYFMDSDKVSLQVDTGFFTEIGGAFHMRNTPLSTISHIMEVVNVAEDSGGETVISASLVEKNLDTGTEFNRGGCTVTLRKADKAYCGYILVGLSCNIMPGSDDMRQFFHGDPSDMVDVLDPVFQAAGNAAESGSSGFSGKPQAPFAWEAVRWTLTMYEDMDDETVSVRSDGSYDVPREGMEKVFSRLFLGMQPPEELAEGVEYDKAKKLYTVKATGSEPVLFDVLPFGPAQDGGYWFRLVSVDGAAEKELYVEIVSNDSSDYNYSISGVSGQAPATGSAPKKQ